MYIHIGIYVYSLVRRGSSSKRNNRLQALSHICLELQDISYIYIYHISYIYIYIYISCHSVRSRGAVPRAQNGGLHSVYIYVCIYIYIYMYIYIYIYMYICMYIYIYICMYVNILYICVYYYIYQL